MQEQQLRRSSLAASTTLNSDVHTNSSCAQQQLAAAALMLLWVHAVVGSTPPPSGTTVKIHLMHQHQHHCQFSSASEVQAYYDSTQLLVMPVSRLLFLMSCCCAGMVCRVAAACRIEVVSWKPRAFIYHNFLSEEEAEHMKRMAAPTVSSCRGCGLTGQQHVQHTAAFSARDVGYLGCSMYSGEQHRQSAAARVWADSAAGWADSGQQHQQ